MRARSWPAGVALLLATALLCTVALAQRAPNTQVPDTGASRDGSRKFNVSIINEAQQPVGFVLRPKDGTWTEYRLTANEKGIYSCYGCDGVFEISIRTGETVVNYTISSGKLYTIRPDPARSIFDIYAVQ